MADVCVIRHKQQRRSLGNSINFKFPSHHHLLIATRERVHTWNSLGLLEIVYQEEGGIVSAQEAGDGSGLLAVAAGLIVMLGNIYGYDTRRWNLRGARDHVTLVRFANNFEELFYSTCLQNSVVQYSITENRVLGHSCLHPSPPIVFAVSTSSNYLLSASAVPPTLYLQELHITAMPILVRPHASESQVTVAQFHSLRETIFLLAYEDGTVSVHSVSRIFLMRNTSSGSDGSIGHLSRSHRHRKHRGTSIIAAAFMSAHPLRLVTVNGDGKCRIVDFKHGTAILRTWHAEAACISMSITSVDSRQVMETDESSYQSLETPDIGIELKQIIALGRVDGYVDLYNGLGLFLVRKLLDTEHGPIVDLDWVSELQRNETAMNHALSKSRDISHMDWTYTFPTLSQTHDQDSEIVMTCSPKIVPRDRQTNVKQETYPNTCEFRQRRYPEKSPTRSVHQHEFLDYSDMPGAWISSSDTSDSMHTAKSSQNSLIEISNLLQPLEGCERHEVTPQNSSVQKAWSKAFQDSKPLRLFSTRGSKSGNLPNHNPFRVMSKSHDRVQHSSRDKSVVPHSLNNTQLEPHRRRLSAIISRKPLAGLSRPDGAGTQGIKRLDAGTESGMKKSVEGSFDAQMSTQSPLPMAPLSSLMHHSPVGSSPTTLPSLASLVQRLRLSSSTAEEGLEDGWVSVDYISTNEISMSNSTSHGQEALSITAPGSSCVSGKPLPLPPSPSLDLPPAIDGLFTFAQPQMLPSPGLSTTFKSLPVLLDTEANSIKYRYQDDCSVQDDRHAHYRCDCECSELLREQLGLLRGEMASLRKAIWCFGSGIGRDRLVDVEREVQKVLVSEHMNAGEDVEAKVVGIRLSEERVEWNKDE